MEVRPGYKQTEVGVIPLDWNVRSLAECCTKITDGTHDTPTPVRSGVPFLTAIHIKEGFVDFENCLYLTESDHRVIFARCDPRRGDILMVNIGAGVGTTARVDVDFEFSLKNVALLKPAACEVSGSYLNYALVRRKPAITQALSSGGAQPFLSLTLIGQIRVPAPSSSKEQDAIAAALSDVDALLGGLDRLIAKKRDIKQAAMQQLLTGQTRLPDFHGEWRLMKLCELCDYVDGIATLGGDLGYLEIGDVNVESKSYDVAQKEKLSVRGAVKVPAGTLLISTVRPTRGAIAITKSELYVSSAFCRVRPVNGLLFHLMCQHTFLAYLGENSIGGTYPTCRDETILEYESLLPSDSAEQTAIAAVLSDIDAELSSLEARREKTRALKQAMMQELLTGKTRLVPAGGAHA